MKNEKMIFLFICVLFIGQAFGQNKDAAFDKMLSELIDFEVPTVTVAKLKKMQEIDKVYLLDAREKNEYNVSHLPDSKNIGYDNFLISDVKDIPKNATIVIYCTVGYRSGKVVEKMQKAGYINTYNLYGSIMEWANQGNTLINSKGQTTKKVHTYSKDWSKWLKRGVRVY
jgi:rhodanese-related sulfurtransferase